MPHNFLAVKEIARQALPRLIENLVMPNLMHRDFSNDFVQGKGDTIQVRKPIALTAKKFETEIVPQDINESTVDVQLDQLATVDVEFTAIERATNVDSLNRMFVEPAAIALAQQINTDGLALLSQITASASGDATTLAPFSQAAKVLNKAKVPLSPRYGVWSPDAQAEFQTIPAIVNAEKSGSTAALRQGSIGNIFGIDNYMAQGVDASMLGAVFHPFAFAFVTRPLAVPAGVECYTTNYNGIGLRVTRGYDIRTKTEIVSMDVLYGYKLLDANLATKVIAKAAG